MTTSHVYAFVVLCGFALPLQAMSVKTCDKQMILSGDIENGDYDLIKSTLRKNPDITVAVLRNSKGGHAETGYQVGEFFRDKSITTYLSGYCLSSCSRMFLGGKERFFTDDFPIGKTEVGFHSNYNDMNQIVPGSQWRLEHFVHTYSDGKADEALVERWVNIKNRNGFAHFFHPTRLNRKDGISILLCDGSEGNQRWSLCEKIPDHDALSMGIITSLDVKRSCDADALPATRTPRLAAQSAPASADKPDEQPD